MEIKTHYILLAIAISIIGVLTMSYVKIKVRTDPKRISLPSIDDVPDECWKRLAGKKIFFGHQSVGYNIIEGIEDIVRERDNIELNIVETSDPAGMEKPIFAHSKVGRNFDATSKIESFKNMMDSGLGNKVDIAFFKLCYVDITRDSDPQEILNSYRVAIDDLKERYPKTQFIHVSVPICSVPKGMKRNLKESVKLLVGKPGVLDDNVMRLRYNKLLNDAYRETGSVFDLALIESVSPGGFRCYANKGAEKVSVMVSEYTEDSGHLNGKGRRRVAEQLLIFLAEMANGL